MALPQRTAVADHDRDHDIDREALIACYVETAPAYPTADRARLGNYGVSVTAIITQLQLEYWNIEEVSRGYDLPIEAVKAAIAYYERHKEVIDARITLNAAAFTDEGRTHEPEVVIPIPVLQKAMARATRAREAHEDGLISRHIESASAYPTPDKARLVDSGTSVTAVITELQGNLWDTSKAARAFNVSLEAIRAAIMYYGRHRSVIDARITLNSAWFSR